MDDILYGGALNDYDCGGPNALFNWIENKAVKAALNVRRDAYFFSGDNGAGFTYDLTEMNLLPFYQDVVTNTSLRIMIINGDVDPELNTLVA